MKNVSSLLIDKRKYINITITRIQEVNNENSNICYIYFRLLIIEMILFPFQFKNSNLNIPPLEHTIDSKTDIPERFHSCKTFTWLNDED